MRLATLVALLVILTVAGCGTAPEGVPLRPTEAAIADPGASDAVLVVNAAPEGAEVFVDGSLRGNSPLTLRLAPGTYDVEVRAPGHTPVTDAVTLAAGQEASYAPELASAGGPAVALSADRTSVAFDGAVALGASAVGEDVTGIELLLEGEPLVAVEGSQLRYTFTPADTAGIEPGQEVVFTARALNSAGMAGEDSLTIAVAAERAAPEATQTPETSGGELLASASPTPDVAVAASAPPAAGLADDVVHYQVGEIAIPTYPYAKYLSPATDPASADYPLRVFDRAAYEAAQPRPAPARYRLITLENRYLKIEFLPDLGGRIYGLTFKPTGSQEFYQNPVVKPTAWGPPSPPRPAGANWWLAAGGMEFGFPVEEHGYEYGAVWGFDNVITPAGGYMVSLFTRDPQRPHVVVDVTLEPGEAFFTMRVRIINPLPEAFRFKWWHNAGLAPGPQNSVGEALHFIWPVTRASIHSTGDATLGAPGEQIDWPVHDGRDLSSLANWTSYLGVFESPAAQGDFTAVYDTAADEGVVRIYPPDKATGAKYFAFGWSQPLDPALWTDDGSSYVEMQGGLAPTYDDEYELASGGEVNWTEIWYPAAGIGGLTHAQAGGALRADAEGKTLHLGVFPVRPVKGVLTIALPGTAPVSLPVEISPDSPFSQDFEYSGQAISGGDLAVTLVDAEGARVLEYIGKITLG